MDGGRRRRRRRRRGECDVTTPAALGNSAITRTALPIPVTRIFPGQRASRVSRTRQDRHLRQRTFNLFHLTFLKYSSPPALPSSLLPSFRVSPMGLIKEYADSAVQTEIASVPSPYADPAVILAAPPVAHRGLPQEAHTGRRNSIPASSPTGSDNAYAVPRSPISPILAPLVSRRLSKRRHPRCPAGEIVNRRIVSMPEEKSEIQSHSHGKRVVSMPDRVRPVLEPSAELFQSPSTAAGDSFGSYSGRRERVRVFRAPSDVPQTPSPPSSPESLLIIAAGAQLPEGFLRRKYSPEPLIEEDDGNLHAYIHDF